MVVFSNQRLGAAAELLVSPEVASDMLRSTAEAARPLAESRWEYELVLWLEDRSRTLGTGLDVNELAWTPDHFERQRRFLTDAIDRAALGSLHARALSLWSRLIEDHPASTSWSGGAGAGRLKPQQPEFSPLNRPPERQLEARAQAHGC